MMQKIHLSILALFSMIAGTFVLLVNGSRVDSATEAQVVAEMVRQQILASTLQIAMYEQATAGAQYEVGSLGLASLVTVGGQRFVLTHDHWTPLTANLHEVELRDAAGIVLMVLDAASFTRLIYYRDGGTMLLQAPAGLAGVLPAEVGTAAAMPPGEVVWLARRLAADGGATVEVVPARVEAVEAEWMPPRVYLRSLDGHVIIPGDSGGGVWSGRQVIGNIWKAGLLVEHTLWTRLTAANNESATTLIMAALHPFTPGNGLDMMETARQSAGAYERRPERRQP
jgi:hypothetical protein